MRHGLTPAPTTLTVRIRDAYEYERGPLEELQRRASDIWPQFRAQLAAAPDAIELPARFIADGWVRVAAGTDDRPVGFSVTIRQKPPPGHSNPGTGRVDELDGLFVEPARMRRGVGTMLLVDACRRARAGGAVALEVMAGPAQHFYEKLGFRVTAPVKSRFGPAVRMRVDLTSIRLPALTHEVTSDVAVLGRLVQPAGKDVVDVGCGTGSLVRELTGLGARVVGVEVSEQQLATALQRADSRGARYVVGRAESLPLEDGTADAVLFMRSLHHVPRDRHLDALREARRVLRPGGVVYVAEPLAEGDFFELVSIVDDETDVRAAAQRALRGAADAGLQLGETVEYGVRFQIADLDALRVRVVGSDPERAPVFDARADELERALGRLGEPAGADGAREFVSPMRADLLVRGD